MDALPAYRPDALGDRPQRAVTLVEFQRKVWDAPPGLDKDPRFAVLRDLAYDLDFFPSDSPKCDEEIRSALARIKLIENNQL